MRELIEGPSKFMTGPNYSQYIISHAIAFVPSSNVQNGFLGSSVKTGMANSFPNPVFLKDVVF